MSHYSFHGKIGFFLFSFKFYFVWGLLPGQRVDTQGWEKNGIEMLDVNTDNKKKVKVKT